jgi:hypothetical protein
MGASEAWNKKLGTCSGCGDSIVLKREMDAASFSEAGWKVFNAGSDTTHICLRPKVRTMSREEMEKLYPPRSIK